MVNILMECVYYESKFNIEKYKDALLQEYLVKKDDAELYLYEEGNFRWPSHVNYYIISKDIPVAQSIAEEFKELYGIECFSRYYILNKGFMLDEHKDAGTQASFNYILSEGNDPLIFCFGNEEIEIDYTKGLLNLQKSHRVPRSNNKRIILKLSIYDHTYEECKRKMKDYENSNIR